MKPTAVQRNEPAKDLPSGEMGGSFVTLRKWEAAQRAKHHREKVVRDRAIDAATAQAKAAVKKVKDLKAEAAAADLALDSAIKRVERLVAGLNKHNANHALAADGAANVDLLRGMAETQSRVTAADRKLLDKYGEDAIKEITGSFCAGLVMAQAAKVPTPALMTGDSLCGLSDDDDDEPYPWKVETPDA